MSDQTPRSGWSTPAKVVDVHDGDTLTVEVTRQITVRIKDCWAPEIGKRNGTRKVSDEERIRGEQARDELDRLLLQHDDVVMLFVPTSVESGSIDAEVDLTFGRVVGEVWAGGMNIGDEMVRRGFATAKKKG